MKREIQRQSIRLPDRGWFAPRWSAARLAASSGLLVLVLAACSMAQVQPGQEVPERAQARWDALLEGDYAKAYSYATPGYRSSTSATDFEIEFRTRRLQYLSAEYRDHECEKSTCTVRMKVGYRIVRPAAGVPEWKSSSVIEEQWIESAGEWWSLPDS